MWKNAMLFAYFNIISLCLTNSKQPTPQFCVVDFGSVSWIFIVLSVQQKQNKKNMKIISCSNGSKNKTKNWFENSQTQYNKCAKLSWFVKLGIVWTVRIKFLHFSFSVGISCWSFLTFIYFCVISLVSFLHLKKSCFRGSEIFIFPFHGSFSLFLSFLLFMYCFHFSV